MLLWFACTLIETQNEPKSVGWKLCHHRTKLQAMPSMRLEGPWPQRRSQQQNEGVCSPALPLVSQGFMLSLSSVHRVPAKHTSSRGVNLGFSNFCFII